MRTTVARVVKYGHSETSKFVVEGLRVAGKRVRKFFPSEREAKAWLRLHLARTAKEGEGALLMPDALRIEAVTQTARLQPYGRSITNAVDHYLAHLAQVQRTCTVDELSAEYQAVKKTDGAKSSYRLDMRYRLSHFAADFGQRKVADISGREIGEWLRGLNQAAQSRNNYRTVLRAVFDFALLQGYATGNPFDKIKPVKVERGPPPILTPAQMRAILEKSPRDYVAFFAVGAFAGLRTSELLRLDWSEVDLGRRLVKVSTESKTGRRNVKISDNLAAWLAPLAQPSGRIITSRNCRFARAFAVTAAGLAEWPDNGLRHSYASYFLEQFKDAPRLAVELGHTNPTMLYKHYREVVLPEDAAQWWQIAPPADFGNVVAFTAAKVAVG
jgi:integrase